MNNIPKFKLRFFLKNFSRDKFEFIKNELTKNIYVNLVEDFSIKEYWKIPDETECILNVYVEDKINLKQILKCYDVGWKYNILSEVVFEYNGIGCIFDDEFAHYVKGRLPNRFIHEDISFAHFYVFPIDPKICDVEEFD